MKSVVYILILSFFSGLLVAQNSESVVGNYKELVAMYARFSSTDSSIVYSSSTYLTVKPDSTFSYASSDMYSRMTSDGKWKMNGDTLLLYDMPQPYIIGKVEEKRLDSLQGKVLIEIWANDSDVYYMDNKYYEPITRSPLWGLRPVGSTQVAINDECDSFRENGDKGRIIFPMSRIYKIRLLYDWYQVKDPSNNHFIVTLSNWPEYGVHIGFRFDRWLLKDGTLVPLKCDGQVDDIDKLRKNGNER